MKQSDRCPALVLDCFMQPMMGGSQALICWFVMTEAGAW